MKSLQLKKYRDKEGLVLLEGHRTIIDALSNGMSPSCILMTNRAFESPLGEELYSITKQLPCVDIIPDAMMKNIVDTVQPQGVCAAFKLPTVLNHLPPTASLLVICDGVKDPGNMGTIFRTSFGLGVDCLMLTEGCVDPYSPKVLRSAMGTVLSPHMSMMQWSWAKISAEIDQTVFQILVCDADGVSYDTVDFTKPSVFVLGSEATGVDMSAVALQRAIRIKIPMCRGLESFNVGVAASIILSEAARQRRLVI